MDSFFDFIFGNFFIVIIIVVALVNLFSKSKGTREQAERTSDQGRSTQRRTPTYAERRQEQPTSLSESIEQKVEQARETFQQARDTITEATQEMPKSIEEQRKEQYEELRRRMQKTQPDDREHKANVRSATSENNHVPVETDSTADDLKVVQQLEKNLTRKGLAESIVMAEVLGLPRALNPYQNVASKRRRK